VTCYQVLSRSSRKTLVREATPRESDRVAALAVRLYNEIGHVLAESVANDVTAALLASEPRYRALLAFALDTEDPVGLLTLAESCATYAAGYFGIVQELYVVPKMRSRGVGQALLERAREIALERNWTRLEVTGPLDPGFARSIAFYRAYGFEDSGPRLFLRVK
jgi:GNAT superfamily N-acetyltransferase